MHYGEASEYDAMNMGSHGEDDFAEGITSAGWGGREPKERIVTESVTTAIGREKGIRTGIGDSTEAAEEGDANRTMEDYPVAKPRRDDLRARLIHD